MAIQKVSKATLLGIAEKKACQLEFNGSRAREVGDIKWVKWSALYHRLYQRQYRKNRPEGK